MLPSIPEIIDKISEMMKKSRPSKAHNDACYLSTELNIVICDVHYSHGCENCHQVRRFHNLLENNVYPEFTQMV